MTSRPGVHRSASTCPITPYRPRREYAGLGPVFGIEFVLLPYNDQRNLKPVIGATQKDEAMSISTPSLNPQTGPYTMLIVDDDPDMRALCATTLVSAGFNVLQAEGSTATMEICVRHLGEIHLALVDVMLPPQDPQWMTERTSWPRVHGHKLIMNLLAKRKGLRAVMMSAHSQGKTYEQWH